MPKIILLSWIFAVAGLTAGEMRVPERWRPPEIAGKEYRIGFKPRGYVIRDPEFMKLPLNRDAFWMIMGSGNSPDFFKDAAENKSSGNYSALMESGNPLMIYVTSYYTNTPEMWSFLADSWPAFRQAAGSRTLGTFATECIQSFNASQKRYRLPDPKSRQEAYEMLRNTWNCKTMTQFRDLSVFFQWGLPRYAGTATYFDHMLLDFGSKCAGHECGSKIHDMPMQFAVSRGAARQYGTFFYSYLATMNDFRYPGHAERKGNFFSHREYNFLIPQERRVHAVGPHIIVSKTGNMPKPPTNTTRGPECGVLDCVYRQWFIYAFMSGAGLYFDEGGHRFMYALYDHRTIGGDDPLVINLRDRKYYLSKTGELLADFYDRIASRIDRGIVCTPIALVWDRYHGYGPKYGGPMPWSNRFPQPGDKMFFQLESYLFPRSPRTTEENVTTRTSPFGDIFDVITNDASLEAMDAYPALLLTGDVSMEHDGFGKRLVQYLENGGTVIASKCQLKEISELSIPDKDTIQEIPFGKGKLIVSPQDYWSKDGEISDELGSVIRKIADEQLPVKVSGDVQYLVNRTKDGVIVSLFNNYGRALNRTWDNPEPGPDPKETQKVAITLKQPASEVRELMTERQMPVRDGRIETSIRGGDVQLIRITFKKIRSPEIEMNNNTYSSLLKKSASFIKANIRTSVFSPDSASFGNGESDNWPVQCTAKAFSALAALGEKEQALALLRYLLATHISGDQTCCDGKKWGHTWIAAGGSLERMMSAVYRIEPFLTEADRKALRRVQLSEADWILNHLPVLAGIDALQGKNKPESNLWNGCILIRAALQYPDAPNAMEYRKKGEILLVNSICTPADNDPRKAGANFTDNLSLDHHGYLNTGYMVICLLHVAILHYDCMMLKKAPPPELYRHVRELWRLVKSCISPDGRLLRIGGDTRVRYAYCQSYLPLVCRFAADYLSDADAPALEKAALERLAKEQSGNPDGSFFAARLSEIRRISPLYYLRCEADVLNMLAVGTLWPVSAPAKEEKIPLLNEWHDEFHGAVMTRTDKTLRSWVCRGADGPVALCVPLKRSDMAEWLHNLTGEIRTAGHCRTAEVRRAMNGNCGCMELVWQTEAPFPEGEQQSEIARQFLAFALLPDGRTMLFVNRITALKYFHAEGGDGIDLKIPNDFFNGYKRTFTGADTDRINADNAVSLVLLSGGEELKVTESKTRNIPICRYPYFNSLKADILGLPIRTGSIDRGEILTDCSYAVIADSPAEELKQFAGKTERIGQDGRVVRWKDPRTGKSWTFTVDFSALTAKLEAEHDRPQ